MNWELIRTHWQELLRVVLSIYTGKISSAVLLRKLGNYSRKNRLYKAFREVGRVVRTVFLLQYISDAESIFHHAVDLTEIIQQLRREGYLVDDEDIKALSPYLTEHIQRFGDYWLDIETIPRSLDEVMILGI